MNFLGFSPKQKLVLTWWMPGGRYAGYEGIICDGAVRSGKTLSMGLGFFLWSMAQFDGRRFGVCGKTIASVRRNVLSELLPRLEAMGFRAQEKRSENRLELRYGGHTNEYYLFGGRDEGSGALIQGITFAGILLDEVALMPRSFVEQACARCSVTGSRLWFNCNPEGPRHWFYTDWIGRAKARKLLYLHFTMEDNPSLSPAIRQRYHRLYSGVFYRRFVLGQWAAAEGRIYDFFDPTQAPPPPPGPYERLCISCDYGTVNPASFGLWAKKGEIWYRIDEFYFDSRRAQRQMTDAEYADALRELAAGRPVDTVVVDPSAASFITTLRAQGWNVRKADNDVLSGIRRTSNLLKSGKIVICSNCADCLRETEEYVWDVGAVGQDKVKKEHDHAMDDMRYFVTTILCEDRAPFAACSVARGGHKEGL